MRRAARLRVILNLFIDVTNRIDTMLRIPDYRFGVPRRRLRAGRDVTRAVDIARKRQETPVVFFSRNARGNAIRSRLERKKTKKEKKETHDDADRNSR